MKEGLILSLMSQVFINAARLFSRDFEILDSSAGLSYFKHYQDK